MAIVPMTLLLGYGIGRTSSLAFQELRNVIFARVAQKAIRSVSRQTFVHLHSLDLDFHLGRQTGSRKLASPCTSPSCCAHRPHRPHTGALARTLDRGSRSIDFVLRAIAFNVFPTVLEIGLVSGILYNQASSSLAQLFTLPRPHLAFSDPSLIALRCRPPFQPSLRIIGTHSWGGSMQALC